MLLALDIGNTNITVGVFQGEKLCATWRLSSDPHRMADEYAVLLMNLLPRSGIEFSAISDVALCSSVPQLVLTFEELSQRYFGIKPLVVGTGIKTGVRVLYDDPRAVGADRVTDAVAAFRTYGGPVIIVDCGTATVLDAVTREGEYLGGAIAPGIQVAVDALVSHTSMLRRIELVRPKHAIGRNTVNSMQSGIIYGYVGLIEGLIARFKQELDGEAKVVATGGLAGIIADASEAIDFVDPDLTLQGLRFVYEMNPDRGTAAAL
ncbi:MAG: type III pantothenate kinase [Dehalococcoidia bacterium]|nr:type III pantothenate kinase [Dehalococcoidia bacterium]